MSHLFTLQPNIALLSEYGYAEKNTELINSYAGLLSPVQVEIDAVWREDQRLIIEQGFKRIIDEYHLEQWHDTLLYICLVESNKADQWYQHQFKSYEAYKREKELAQFLLLTRPENRHQPNQLKIASLTATLKVTDQTLIAWMGWLVQQAVINQDVLPSELGDFTFKFTADETGNIAADQGLNYDQVTASAEKVIRRPGKRERNRALAPFLLQVLHFLNQETTLKAEEGVRFSNEQLMFMFKVAVLLEWIGENDFDSEPKDYMHTLLTNFNRL